MNLVTGVTLGDSEVGVAVARRTPAGVELLQAATAPLPEGYVEKPAAERAAMLRDTLARCGGWQGKVVAVLPWPTSLIRRFEVPPGNAEEVQQMVRFQAEKELPMALDQVLWSYVEESAEEGKRRITLAAVPHDRAAAVRVELEAAGLHVQDAYLSSFGLAGLAAGLPPSEGGTAILGMSGKITELVIVEGGAPVFSRYFPDSESPETLAGEIFRTLLSYRTRFEGHEVRRVIVAGEDERALAVEASLKGRLEVAVERSSFRAGAGAPAGPAVTMGVAAAVGVCFAVLRGQPPMPNLFHLPAVPRRVRVKLGHRVAILSSMIAVALILWAQLALSDRDAELRRKREEMRRLEPQVTAVNQMRERTRLAQNWLENRHSWVDTFDALQQKVDRTKVWITKCDVDDSGQMRLQGRSTDNEVVSTLISQLQKQPAFSSVAPEFTRPNADRGAYKFDFGIRIQLEGLGSPKGAVK